MATGEEQQNLLIASAYAGPVFGPGEAFGVDAQQRIPAVQAQIGAVAEQAIVDLQTCIQQARPELSPQEVRKQLREIISKTAAFVPALTVAELQGDDNMARLIAVTNAVGGMYFADQTLDRAPNGEPLLTAIKMWCGANEGAIAAGEEKTVDDRTNILAFIAKNVRAFTRIEDEKYVMACFDQQVLLNEVYLYELSREYKALASEAARKQFLGEHAVRIANLMVADAGVPSVSSSLYAIYRHDDPSLPQLSKVYAKPKIEEMLQVCNAVARITDELGDWETDAGQRPEWGVFMINPFNEYHPAMVGRLCTLACIEDPEQVEQLQQAFSQFHTSPEAREQHGAFVLRTIFAHARNYIHNLPQDVQRKHAKYIQLCKRVLEISEVNKMGDIKLASTED